METIQTLEETTRDQLATLAQYNRASAKGFTKAVEIASDPALIAYFREIETQRKGNALSIEGILGISGEIPDADDAMVAKFHRWWMELRDKLTDDTIQTLLAEVVRGEQALNLIYEDAILEITGNPVNAMLHEQLSCIKKSKNRVEELYRLMRQSAELVNR